MADQDERTESLITGRAALYALAAIIGGGGGSLVMDQVRDPRPDPYTGSDGLKDKVEIYARIDRVTSKIERLKDDVHKMELDHRDMTNAQHHFRELLVDMQKHLNEHKDSKHPPTRH